MKLVYSAPLAAMVHIGKGMLEQAGIPCIVKGEHLRGGTGDLPAFATWVELWVLRDHDEQAALRLIEEGNKSAGGNRLRRCAKCSAEIEGPFDACWQCGADLVTV